MPLQSTDTTNVVDNAVAEGGAYDVIRKRLLTQGDLLSDKTHALNNARLQEFGSSEMQVKARVRVRTENNCIARDIVQVGDRLLFAYNVFVGLKKDVKVEDVFALFTLSESQAGHELNSVSTTDTFLSQSSFVSDFDELYRYYKNARLIQLIVKDGKLLAAFQIGERLDSVRVFRWSVSHDGQDIKYIDNRGERDIQLPPSFDFDWTETTRDDVVNGRHPHVNVLDTLFIETLDGSLTIKVENNTSDGLGIYSEPVEDSTQSLDDADFFYAKSGGLILLKIRPYREEKWRYFIFNTLLQSVLRLDDIGDSCVHLPEDHGLIFPGGYYLQTGEYKTFDDDAQGLLFKRSIRSPNGEDVLYVFYEPEEGRVGLFGYNIIQKEMQNPIYGHGYALAEDGKIVIFLAEEEATRIHPMQLWETPFVSKEFISSAAPSQSFYGRIGNAQLVRGISDLLSICRIIDNQSVSAALYEELIKLSGRLFDSHFWIEEKETNGIDTVVHDIMQTAELIVDEFEKVQSIRASSEQTMEEAEKQQDKIIANINAESWQKAEDYVDGLSSLRQQRGHLASIREYRYIDRERISELDEALLKSQDSLAEKTVYFLSDDKAFEPYDKKIQEIDKQIAQAETNAELTPVIESIEKTASDLDLLSELMSTLSVADTTIRTKIIDGISKVYSKINQSKATANHKRKNVGSEEATKQFSAQLKLFSQSIANALGQSDTPDRCDEQMSRILVQLEELESQFSDFDQFLSDILGKRDEVYENFETRKQSLIEERQRKAQSISDAADRMLKSIERRSLKFVDSDPLNTYFASDALIIKTRELIEKLRGLDSAVKADDVESRLKALKEQALRSLRDKADIYEDGGNIIKLGPRHKFSVNTQELDLTIIPRNKELNIHLSGTDFYEPIESRELSELRAYWDLSLDSETDAVYRAEYLAFQILQAADSGQDSFDRAALNKSSVQKKHIDKLIRDFAAPRYKEGYEKGVHDHDASLILQALLPALETADLLRFPPKARALTQIYWANTQSTNHDLVNSNKSSWLERAQSATLMQRAFASSRATELLVEEVHNNLQSFFIEQSMPVETVDLMLAAEYLVCELSRDHLEFISSKYALELHGELKRSLNDETWRKYQLSLKKISGRVAERWSLSEAWLSAMLEHKKLHHLEKYIPEAIALLNTEERISRRESQADLELKIESLMGDHKRMQGRTLALSIDEFLQRLQHHQTVVIPAYHRYLDLRKSIMHKEKQSLRLEEFKARPLSSFVRNKLINDAYLPLIGDNLAKQMGTVGEDRRTDLMGLLMMISPPGYGKTTLMEYVASRLGLIFMKINCPSLGHEVVSLDPEQAPNVTARQELVKLNLGLEMGSNVMLYLDDIQHTDAEFLQKFISLCDGTRRIDGVWKGRTKTYDMRGKKFCVVMAGNPYTESGEAFKVPDMLANRADIYNLGDILGGMDEQFALSYVENCLTSNKVLAPLATRDIEDVYMLIDLAKGKEVATTDLSHQYSGAELNEISDIFKKLLLIQDIVLKINQQYIKSAAQDEKYRTEPSFKLQGSYRNMNKMAEKISSVMNHDELMQLVSDHYTGEAQMLTSGAEENLLKLAMLRGNITPEEQARWQQICQDFLHHKAMGGDGADGSDKIAGQLFEMVNNIESIGESFKHWSTTQEQADKLDGAALITEIQKLSEALNSVEYSAVVVNQPVEGVGEYLKLFSKTIEESFVPLVEVMSGKLDLDLTTHSNMSQLLTEIQSVRTAVEKVAYKKPFFKKAKPE